MDDLEGSDRGARHDERILRFHTHREQPPLRSLVLQEKCARREARLVPLNRERIAASAGLDRERVDSLLWRNEEVPDVGVCPPRRRDHPTHIKRSRRGPCGQLRFPECRIDSVACSRLCPEDELSCQSAVIGQGERIQECEGVHRKVIGSPEVPFGETPDGVERNCDDIAVEIVRASHIENDAAGVAKEGQFVDRDRRFDAVVTQREACLVVAAAERGDRIVSLHEQCVDQARGKGVRKCRHQDRIRKSAKTIEAQVRDRALETVLINRSGPQRPLHRSAGDECRTLERTRTGVQYRERVDLPLQKI